MHKYFRNINYFFTVAYFVIKAYLRWYFAHILELNIPENALYLNKFDDICIKAYIYCWQ